MDPVVVVYGRSSANTAPAGLGKADLPPRTETSSRPKVPAVGLAQALERRLGAGTLPLRRLVLPDDALSALLSSARPPELERVAIGWLEHGLVRVEVIEVLSVMRSEPGVGPERIWGIELAEPAETPGTFEAVRPPDYHAPLPAHVDLTDLMPRLRRPIPPLPGPERLRPPQPTQPPPPATVPAGLWCFLFPRATFCR